jgi:hypothetical protein
MGKVAAGRDFSWRGNAIECPFTVNDLGVYLFGARRLTVLASNATHPAWQPVATSG